MAWSKRASSCPSASGRRSGCSGPRSTAVGWPRCGEIDVMENFGRDRAVVHGTVHGPGYAGQAGITTAYTAPTISPTTSTGMPSTGNRSASAGTSMRWCTARSRHGTWTGRPWLFDHPFYLLLNVAVGGEFSQPPAASVSPADHAHRLCSDLCPDPMMASSTRASIKCACLRRDRCWHFLLTTPSILLRNVRFAAVAGAFLTPRAATRSSRFVCGALC